jgi:single-strand DNA-binding protein
MASLNKVFLIGNLTRDPERRALPSGMTVTDLRLAVSRKFRLQSGEDREETLFINVATFGKQAETVAKFMRKGRPILIEGRLRMEEWENKEGQKQSRISVVADHFQFLGGPERGGSAEMGDAASGAGSPGRRPAPSGAGGGDYGGEDADAGAAPEPGAKDEDNLPF